jgi:uncharacterized RDD family membrane protein YckC
MRYGGIFRRAGAFIVDGIVLSPLNAVGWVSPYLPPGASLPLSFFAYSFRAAYEVVLHALYGRTLGKMALGLRVLAVDGEHISWGRALLRSAPMMLFGLMEFSAMALMMLLDVTLDSSAPEPSLELLDLMEFLEYAQGARVAWNVCDAVVLLFNERHRALTDFLAGTVVVIVEKGAADVRAGANWEPEVPRFKSPEFPPRDEPGPFEHDPAEPLPLFDPSGAFSCPECRSVANFGASECRGCGERFRYLQGRAYLALD